MKQIILVITICSMYAVEPFDLLKSATWKSDKEATIYWIKKHRPGSAKLDKLGEIFGKLTITYANDAVVSKLDGKENKQDSKMIGQTSRDIAFITNDALTSTDVIVLIEIDEDENGYWIYNSQFDIREHFLKNR